MIEPVESRLKGIEKRRIFPLAGLLVSVFLVLATPSTRGNDELTDPGEMIFRQSEDVTPASWKAARRGLDYLAASQNADGSWDGDVGFKLNQNYEVIERRRPHVGVTALAGIAFLAGGHLPDRGRYAKTISKCIDYILASVRDRGFVTDHSTRMYSHAFATLFLAEVYGMTHRSDVGKKLQETVNLIVECQNKVGSWRYEPFAPESDMSITVCQLMALRAARNIGIKVPRTTIDRAVDYVRKSYVDRNSTYLSTGHRMLLPDPYYSIEEGTFLYQIFQDQNSGYYRSSFSLTAAGVVSLFNAGHYSSDKLKPSLDFILRKYDIVSSDRWRGHYFFWYGHYYAVQAMYIAGGRYWASYYPKIREELIRTQRKKGNWENFVGPGENFATAVAAIILQIPYNYLPIFHR